MRVERRGGICVAFAAALLLTAAAQMSAQVPAAAPVIAVLTDLTIKPGVDRAQLMKVMPDEVRATIKLYLDGKIQQWYARADGRGVLFILNCSSVAEAQALMDTLPFATANLTTFEFTALNPLMPLRALLAEPATPPKKDPQP